MNRKSQKSGDNSLNFQADNVTVNTGLTISHVRELALEVFEDNFNKLAGVAKDTAEYRAKEITEQFLEELYEKNPDGMKASEDPDFQHSLYQMQKEYARYGDKELGDILVDILVDRSKEEERSLLQIVLNESLSIAPKLDTTQLDILACCFNLFYVKRLNIKNIQEFANYLNEAILIFSAGINKNKSNYNHLEYVACASIRTGSRNIVNVLKKNYQAIFCKGYSYDDLKDMAEEDPNIMNVHIPCQHDDNLYQAGGMDDEAISEMCNRYNISDDHRGKLIKLNKQNLMDDKEAQEFLESICPNFQNFLEDANSTPFISMELTSVGIAIAHAHSRKKVGFDADLSIWI